jgi:drug/metabolite transporter (DMT)-like permease
VILAFLYCLWFGADFARWWAAPAGVVAAPWAGWANPVAWAVLLFTAVVPGYLADVCQAKGQESVSASESQVLLAGEPLFAAVFGAALLGESLGTWGYVGGAGLVAGAILAGLDDGSGSGEEKSA